MLQLLQDSPLNSEQRNYLETSLYSGRNLLRVINDILDFSKIEAGKMDMLNEPFDAPRSFRMIYDTFKPETIRRGLKWNLYLDDNLPPVLWGDEGRIRQILFNLVGNAIKFTSHGQVQVRIQVISKDPETSEISLLLTVEDTGIGIAEDKLETIFESFTQADGTTTRKYGGSGLGLTIVRQLVQLMGGDVAIESQLGQGTRLTFGITLKYDDTPLVTNREASVDDSLPPLGHLKILLAEDEKINRLTASRFLQNMGHQVVIATNGQEAVEAVFREDFDCVLMDIQMPVLDGTEATILIRNARELGDKSCIPIIALTAHALSGDKERFLENGMTDYLPKPLDKKELDLVLRRIMSGRLTLEEKTKF